MLHNESLLAKSPSIQPRRSPPECGSASYEFSITTFFSIAALKVFELARTSLPKVTIKRMKLRAALFEGS